MVCIDGYELTADKDTTGVITCGVDPEDDTNGKWEVNGGADLAQFSCKPEKLVLCEKLTATVQCPAGGYKINIIDAFYGRKSSTICPGANSQTTDCHKPASKDKVVELCQGKTSCEITASNTVFGDPCGGVSICTS